MNYRDYAKPNNLKALRLKRGISQCVLAHCCCQNPSVICLYEAGKRMPRYDVLRCIARTLGVKDLSEIYPAFKKLDRETDQTLEFLIYRGKLKKNICDPITHPPSRIL